MSLLLQRHEDRQRREEYMVGLLASVTANPHRKRNTKPSAPADWFPSLRAVDDVPEWVQLKRSFGFR